LAKTITELQGEKAKDEMLIVQEQHKLQRLNNRIGYYEKGDRQKRAHRLITRGAAVESVAPELKSLTETEFYLLAEHIFSLSEVNTAILCAVANHSKSISEDSE